MHAYLAGLVIAAVPCGPLDLAAAQAQALLRSDELAIKQSEVLSAEADLAIAKALRFFPKSTATVIFGPSPEAHGNLVSYSDNTNRSLRSLEPFGRVDINMVQPLYTWGRLDAARDAARAGVQARQLLVKDTRNEVLQRILQLYWGQVLAQRLLDLAGDIDEALKKVDAQLKKSLDKDDGTLGQEDKFRIELFRSELTQRKADAVKGLRLARVGMAAMLRVPESTLVLKHESLAQTQAQPVPNHDASLASAASERPDLLALDQAIEAKHQQVLGNQAARYPQIFLGLLFAYSYAPNRDIQLNPWVQDYFNNLSVGLAVGARQDLAIPSLQAELRKSRAELVTLKHQRDGLARFVSVQVEQALADVQAASDKRTAAHGALTAGKGWYRSAGLNFAAGVGDAKALVDAFTGYVKTQLDDAQSAYEYRVALGHLQQVTGTLSAPGAATCDLPSP